MTDAEFAADSVAPGLMPYLYMVLGNAQSHSGQPWLLEDVFSPEELKEQWMCGNAEWFIHGGNTDMTGGRMPFVQRNLLEKNNQQGRRGYLFGETRRESSLRA